MARRVLPCVLICLTACGATHLASPDAASPLDGTHDLDAASATDAVGRGSAAAMGGLLGGGASVHGIKIQCVADPNNSMVCAIPVTYETHGLRYADAVAQLAANGVDDIVIKVCELNNQCPQTASFGEPERNAIINTLLAAFHDATDSTNAAYIPGYHPHIYLWQRWWLWDGSLGTRADQFSDDMSSVLTSAYAAGLGDMIDGVGVIETQLESSSSVLSQALVVAARINADTTALVPNGWLTTHALMFPGAANGAWFDAIDTQPASSTFFAQMSAQAAHFAFVFKNMPIEDHCSGGSNDNTLCASGMAGTKPVATYGRDFVDCLDKSAVLTTAAGDLGNFDCTTDAGKASYLLAPSAQGGIGLGALQAFIANDCGAHPNVTNALFWGDSADGFSEMSAGNVRALHQVLVDDAWSVPPGGACGAAGYTVPLAMRDNQLSHKAIVPTAPNGADATTHVFVASSTTTLAQNTAAAAPKNHTAYTDPLTVWQEWMAWSAPTSTCAGGSAAGCY